MRKKRRWLFRISLVLVLLGSAAYFFGGPTVEEGSYLVVDISGSFEEGQPSGLLRNLIAPGATLADLTQSLAKARNDGRIDGVITRIGNLGGGWGQAEEIRGELGRTKAAGKHVVALLEGDLDGASKELYLASVADRVYVPPGSGAVLNGLAAQYMFLGGVWEKLDLTMDVEQIREYKTAGDMVARKEMSDAHRKMADDLLDELNDHLVNTLANARNLTPDEILEIVDRCPSSAKEMVESGLVDGVRSYDGLLTTLGSGDPVPVVRQASYAKVSASSLGLGGGPKLAVIHAAGTIRTGKTPPGGRSVGATSLSAALRSAGRDDDIKAIVLRVDSPGGSAAGSDQIWQSAREAATHKPVVASLADVAASGGYYIAAGADHIVAESTTLTGSIGVVLVKPDVSGLLDRLGIATASISRGRYARLMDMTKPFDEDELALIRRRLDGIYDLFVERVAAGREITTEQVDALGGGRVWTGSQALEHGLVDELGGLATAVAKAAAAAGIHDPDKVELTYYPKASGLAGELARLQTTLTAALGPAAGRGLLGQIERGLALLDLEPGIYTLLPSVPTID